MKQDNLLRNAVILFMACLLWFMIGLKVGLSECTDYSQVTDNQLIEHQDSLFLRVSVRIDTTYHIKR
jgi:hypothetical protein